MKILKNVIFISLFLCLFISCVGGTSSKKVKAGSIDYKIAWNTSKTNGLPKKMRLLYSEQGCCLEFEKMFSFIGLRFSKEFKRDSANFLIDMGGIGTYANFPMKDVSSRTNKVQSYKLSERKKILDYNCNTIQYRSNGELFSIKVYYTNKLNIDVVNRLLPEIETKGAILGIEIINKEDRVYIEATNVSEKQVDPNLFIVPKNYTKNSYKQILSVLNGFVK